MKHLIPGSVEPFVRMFYYRHLIRTHEPEKDAIMCRSFVEPGNVVIDVGANLGFYCKALAQAGAIVHALEPVPETFLYLVSDMEALHLSNVFCYNVAASDSSGMARMQIPKWKNGRRNIYESHLTPNGDISVRTVRLDDLFPDLCPVLIKCDVEGHEVEVIDGAGELIERCHPTWLIEVNSPRTVARMKSLGYSARPATGSNTFFTANGFN